MWREATQSMQEDVFEILSASSGEWKVNFVSLELVFLIRE